MRTFQKLVDGEWVPTMLYKLQYDDYFRAFDNVAPVSDNGKYIFRATSCPYYTDDYSQQRIDYETC